MNVSIRQARPTDAAFIIRVHYDAVHIIAAEDYEITVLNEWSNNAIEKRIEKKQQQMQEDSSS